MRGNVASRGCHGNNVVIGEREYYLSCVAEECLEVAFRVQKAIRFGLFEEQPGQTLNNWQRIAEEWSDLLTAMDVLIESEGLLHARPVEEQQAKRAKIAHYLKHAYKEGQVT